MESFWRHLHALTKKKCVSYQTHCQTVQNKKRGENFKIKSRIKIHFNKTIYRFIWRFTIHNIAIGRFAFKSTLMIQNKHNECAMYTSFQLLRMANKSISVCSVLLVIKLYRAYLKSCCKFEMNMNTQSNDKKLISQIRNNSLWGLSIKNKWRIHVQNPPIS